MRTSFPALLVLALASAVSAPAQTTKTIVSPTTAASVEGPGGNFFPWVSTTVRRYQQIHGDLGSGVKAIRKIGWRMNQTATPRPGVRALDITMLMGRSRKMSQLSFFMDRNFAAAKTTVLARKVIDFGPQGTSKATGPNPFIDALAVALDRPFIHTGTTPLVWEVVVHRAWLKTAYSMTSHDVDRASAATASSTVTVAGCVVKGRTTAMALTTSYSDVNGALMMSHRIARAPANAPAFLAIGTANPNAAVPGLCGRLGTNLVLVFPIGATDGEGQISLHHGGQSVIVLENNIQGATLFLQAHVIDAGSSSAIPLANSNGRTIVVPSSDMTKVVRVSRIWNNVGGAAAKQAIHFSTSTLGYGLVTQFTYQ